jgi:hypothetical protein
VNVYPNPSSDKVTVKVDYQGNTQIRLIDAMGNEKYSGSFKGSIEFPFNILVLAFTSYNSIIPIPSSC